MLIIYGNVIRFSVRLRFTRLSCSSKWKDVGSMCLVVRKESSKPFPLFPIGRYIIYMRYITALYHYIIIAHGERASYPNGVDK